MQPITLHDIRTLLFFLCGFYLITLNMSVLYANTPFIKGELPAMLSEYLSSVWLYHLHLNGAFIDQEADRLWHFSGKLKNRTEENQQVREWLEKTMLTVMTISPGMTTPPPTPPPHLSEMPFQLWVSAWCFLWPLYCYSGAHSDPQYFILPHTNRISLSVPLFYLKFLVPSFNSKPW